jgi:3-oxoacyl-[acyl-carrier-protein] synthase-3
LIVCCSSWVSAFIALSSARHARGHRAQLPKHRLGHRPAAPRLRLKWVHQKSFSGDHPVCMQLGLNLEGTRSYLDYDSASAAEADGALALRQDIRLLPNLFDIAIHEYAGLVRQRLVDPQRVDHFLCHYSSERFRPVVDELMHAAQLAIPQQRWWTNLHTRGNTGAASLFVMLSEFVRTRELKDGEQIFCFVPESGRFTVAYALFEVERPGARPVRAVTTASSAPAPDSDVPPIAAPHEPSAAGDPRLAALLQRLAEVWHDYRSEAWRTPLVRALVQRRFTPDHYVHWMACWIPQVREGSRWMREAVASMRAPYAALADLVETHAGEEQFDFRILFDDYRSAGGTADSIDALRRTPGGEALNSYLHAKAAVPNPVGLLGAIYVIEGTGQRIVPALLPLLQSQLKLPPNALRFLAYHGANDEHHLARWLRAVQLVLAADPSGRTDDDIVQTARRTAALYLMQWQDACTTTP